MSHTKPAEVTSCRRVLLKLSGESLTSPGGSGIGMGQVRRIAGEILAGSRGGVQIGVVVGAGNMVRGAEFSAAGADATTADYMGMLATVINGLALQDALERLGAEVRTQTAITMRVVAEPYIRRRAIRHMEKGRIVILTAGTGNPHFTTDTAAALRAREIGAEILLKASTVDGIYSDDPAKNPDATRFDRLSYDEAIKRRLRVMDATAFTICRDAKIPILVFDMRVEGNIERAIRGEPVGTRVSAECSESGDSG